MITSTLHIPEGVILRVDPEVALHSQVNDMFLVRGPLITEGSADNEIVFNDIGGNIFNGKFAGAAMSVSVNHVSLRNGSSIWPATGDANYGSLTLRNSQITDTSDYSYIWYPANNMLIEKNVFSNSAGFSIGFSSGTTDKVVVRNNRFVSKHPSLPDYMDYWIRNWACYCPDSLKVEFNSFLDDGIAVELESGHDSTSLDAKNNYWGTNDEQVIASKIYDQNDDITTAGTIPFNPYLSEPHGNTP